MGNQYAVITGASQGLGRSFAEEVSKRGFNTILISLPDQGLKELCSSLSEKYGTESCFFETDLSVFENVIKLTQEINRNFEVFMLINNAGIGGTKKFEEADHNYINSIIQVNVMGTSMLTHQLIPNLLQREKSYILNVSSIAAFCPIAYKTVYPASKAFINSFSRGLCEEFKNTNLHISVVNPGPMATNQDVCSRIKTQGLFGKFTMLNPDKVAAKCISKVLAEKPVIVMNPVSQFLLKNLPAQIKLPLLSRTFRKEICT